MGCRFLGRIEGINLQERLPPRCESARHTLSPAHIAARGDPSRRIGGRPNLVAPDRNAAARGGRTSVEVIAVTGGDDGLWQREEAEVPDWAHGGAGSARPPTLLVPY